MRAQAVTTFRLASLEMLGFRGFTELRTIGWGRLNLLVGINGAGKSAILDAIVIALSPVASALTDEEVFGSIKPSDLSVGSDFAQVLGLIVNKPFLFKCVRTYNKDGEESINNYEDGKGAGLHQLVKSMAGTAKRGHLPIMAQYTTSRNGPGVPSAGREVLDGPLAAYEGAFVAERRFPGFYEWFREREDVENQQRARGRDFEDPQLRTVRHVIDQMMGRYTGLYFDRITRQMLFPKGNAELTLDQLSSGEKTVIALASDLARRLAIANPALENPLHGAGIVLIDEVDLHLHPTWQRRVVKRLPEIFPNLQFFMTTHSPVAASSVPPGSLFLVHDGKVEKKEAFGQDVGLVLDELFDTPSRDEEVQRDLDALFEAITLGNAEDAVTRLTALESILGTNDPLLVRARTRMRGLGLA